MRLITKTHFQTFFQPILGCLRTCAFFLLTTVLSISAFAGTPIDLTKSFAGDLDFVITGGSFRLSPNGTDACSVGNSSSATISAADIPTGATVKAAYMYWSGSYSTQNGSTRTTPDYNISLNGAGVPANQQFTETFPYNNTTYDFFGGIADVTSQISARSSISGTYTASNLSVNTGTPHCGVSVVLAGWSLVVVYEHASEPLRVVNLFEGFEYYRGSSISLTPTNFNTPASPTGKHAHITWEGDEGNSNQLGIYSEELRFQGNLLIDGQNPEFNQFNSHSSALNADTYGVDIDIYDITSFLSAGLTSVTTTYSSGGDFVILNAEVISVENTPVADFQLAINNSDTWVEGQLSSFNISTSNLGPSDSTGQVAVAITLPNDLAYQSFTGSGWNCVHTAGTVNCTNNSPLNNGFSLSDIQIFAQVSANSASSVSVSATVSGPLFDNISINNSDSITLAILAADISTSTLTVSDVNGGDLESGDILSYTLTLIESAGYAGGPYIITGDLPSLANSFTVTAPTGNDQSLSAPAGANGTGYVDIANVSVNANGQWVFIYDVVIGTGNSDEAIDLTLDISGLTLIAPTMFYKSDPVPSSGNKPLYFNPGNTLSRIDPTTNSGEITIAKDETIDLTQTPAFQSDFDFDPGANSVALNLWLKNNETGNNINKLKNSKFDFELIDSNGDVIASVIGINIVLSGNWSYQSVALPFTAALSTLVTGEALTLQITNKAKKDIFVNPFHNASNSQIILPAATVINVDSITKTDDANNLISQIEPLNNLNINTIISDPFGSFDITDARITLTDSLGAIILNNIAMTQTNDSGAATKTYSSTYPLPIDAPEGSWKISITGIEGFENEVSHTLISYIEVTRIIPTLTLVKSSTTLSDPINGTTTPSRIPGSEIRYELVVSNTTSGYTNNNSTAITDEIPNNSILYVNDFAGAGLGPVQFIDGTQPSGLTYNFLGLSNNTDSLFFSTDGSDFSYTPTADIDGYDTNVTHIRVQPSGVFTYSTGSSHPQFELRFKTKIQ